MNARVTLIVLAVVAVIAAGAVFLLMPDGQQTGAPAPDAPTTAAPDAIAEALKPVVSAARQATTAAEAEANAAATVVAAADTVAANAARAAGEAKTAAETATTAAESACKKPSAKLACAKAEDGTHYAGDQSCDDTRGCGPDGFGVLTDERTKWSSAGRWTKWLLTLGCDTMDGKITYCGAQSASAWNGFGISYNENAAAISAAWKDGQAENPLQLDYPTGSRMRGDMKKYELSGRGIYERNDGVVMMGLFSAGKIVSGVVRYPASGDMVLATFGAGLAASGSIRYRDGSIFTGRLDDHASLPQPRPLQGVLLAPDGTVRQQGSWKDGNFVG